MLPLAPSPALGPVALPPVSRQAVGRRGAIEALRYPGAGRVERPLGPPGRAERTEPRRDRFDPIAARVPEDDARQVLPGMVRAVDEVGLGGQPIGDARGAARDRAPPSVPRRAGEELAHLDRGEAGCA